MSEPTLQELKDLIVDLSNQVTALDKKVDTGLIRLEGEIKQVKTELTGKIEQVKTELTGKIEQVKTELTGKIEKVEEKVSGIDKRLSNEETISRTAIGALVVASLAGLIKYLFFPQA